VDDEILAILRQRRLECEHYHGHDAGKYCQKVTDDYLQSEANWFAKCKLTLEIFWFIWHRYCDLKCYLYGAGLLLECKTKCCDI